MEKGSITKIEIEYLDDGFRVLIVEKEWSHGNIEKTRAVTGISEVTKIVVDSFFKNKSLAEEKTLKEQLKEEDL